MAQDDRTRKLLMLVVVLALVAASAATAWAARRPGPGFCECANIDAPVICDGGKIYINPCVAACFHATHCVPYGDGGGIP